MSLETDLQNVYARRERLRRLHNTPGYGSNEGWRKGVFKDEQYEITKEELRLRAMIPEPTQEDIDRVTAEGIDYPNQSRGAKILLIRTLQKINFDDERLTEEQQKVIGEAWTDLKFNVPQNELDAAPVPDHVLAKP